MRAWIRIIAAVACLLCPAAASAQGSITGVVRDSSGGVLPGVTVEASSGALIEKTRAVVSDGTGQYRIVDLRPGIYSVTFALTGFTTVKREGIELTGAFTATVNADMRVGSVQETITVTGETPTVDVQATTREKVLDHDVIDAIPTGRLRTQLAILIPGVSNAGTVGFNGMTAQDVGGAGGDQQVTLSIHGSRGNDQRIAINGMNIGWSNTTLWSAYSPNVGATQEVAVDTAAASAEVQEGGVRMNLIPREGGNRFTGSLFAGFANDSMTANNLAPDLIARGLAVANRVKRVADVNPGFGGPILNDTVARSSTGTASTRSSRCGRVRVCCCKGARARGERPPTIVRLWRDSRSSLRRRPPRRRSRTATSTRPF
jgi:hypothetical protein